VANYHSLERNSKRMGFVRGENEQGVKLSWRWQTRAGLGGLMVLEPLADAPQMAGRRLQPLTAGGAISALNIPHSSFVIDLHRVTPTHVERLGVNGMVTKRVNGHT